MQNGPNHRNDGETLVLVPTQFERDQIDPAKMPPGGQLELTGFGPIAAAARSAELIARLRPRRVILFGIAGRYTERLSMGSAYEFGHVSCYGIGAGQGAQFQTAHQMGWQQWSDSKMENDSLPLDSVNDLKLMTVCSAAASMNDVQTRLATFPGQHAEDMEGFGVALACQLADVPLQIVRGISNQAGDRDLANWRIPAAINAAWEYMTRLLEESSE